jgi:hypothetical protein
MCSLSVTTTSLTLRDMDSCEEEGIFSRSLTVFQNFLGLDPQRENWYHENGFQFKSDSVPLAKTASSSTSFAEYN